MEALLVGAVGLGGLYAISKQESRGFQDKVNNPPQQNGLKTFPTDNQATQKYLNQQTFEKELHNVQKITDAYQKQLVQNQLTSNNSVASQGVGHDQGGISNYNPDAQPTTYMMNGQPFDANTFTHNNMVPFFGAKIRGRGPNQNQAESILDNMNGSGALQMRHTEQAPLFRPEENMQWAHGQPVNTDFYQSRVNPGRAMNNVKPWQEERVGPGLGQGFTTEGSNGFNSGMEARNSWLPKTVNELRVDTNPKETFGLINHEGPANSVIKQSGILGNVYKFRPDTYFENGPDRYFTTTGQEKGQTLRSLEELKDQTRSETSAQYSGVAGPGQVQAHKAPENFAGPKRPHVYGEGYGVPNAAPHCKPTTDADYGRPGHYCLNNHRSTTGNKETRYGHLGNVLHAAVAPLLDVLRPSRKENVIGNYRLLGNVQQTNGSSEYVYNPADRAKMTIRQMTECGKFHMNVENQSANGYLVSKQQSYPNQRDTTNTEVYGGGNDTSQGLVLEDQYRRQRNNVNKVTGPASIHGNMATFNGNYNANLVDRSHENTRGLISSTQGVSVPTPSKELIGQLSGRQVYDQCTTGCDRIQPDLLDAFRKNPYTQSLHSHA